MGKLKRYVSLMLILVIFISVLALPASAKSYTYNLTQLTSINKAYNDHPYVLKKGFWANTKALVKPVQNMLNDLGYANPKLDPDGDFGNKTDKVLRAYQKAKKLQQDGIVGPKTWESLVSDYVKLLTSLKLPAGVSAEPSNGKFAVKLPMERKYLDKNQCWKIAGEIATAFVSTYNNTKIVGLSVEETRNAATLQKRIAVEIYGHAVAYYVTRSAIETKYYNHSLSGLTVSAVFQCIDSLGSILKRTGEVNIGDDNKMFCTVFNFLWDYV